MTKWHNKRPPPQLPQYCSKNIVTKPSALLTQLQNFGNLAAEELIRNFIFTRVMIQVHREQLPRKRIPKYHK